jgi:hypothetical protein
VGDRDCNICEEIIQKTRNSVDNSLSRLLYDRITREKVIFVQLRRRRDTNDAANKLRAGTTACAIYEPLMYTH